MAANGEEAVAFAQSTAYDLILMDCQMPVMDGFQATEAIRKNDECASRTSPIVAITAFAMPGDRERCLEAGMNDYISKPLKRQQFQDIVHAWLYHEERND